MCFILTADKSAIAASGRREEAVQQTVNMYDTLAVLRVCLSATPNLRAQLMQDQLAYPDTHATPQLQTEGTRDRKLQSVSSTSPDPFAPALFMACAICPSNRHSIAGSICPPGSLPARCTQAQGTSPQSHAIRKLPREPAAATHNAHPQYASHLVLVLVSLVA